MNTLSPLTPSQRALLESMLSETRLSRLKYVLSQRLDRITLVLDNLLDPHNMAAICRSAEAFGITDLYSIHREYPLSFSNRVSRYSHKWLLLHPYGDTRTCMRELKNQGFAILSAQMTLEAVPLAQVRVSANSRLAVVLGNEHEGVHPDVMCETDQAVAIPMFGFTESFNVSVAAALILQSLTTRMRQAIAPETSTLSPMRSELLYDHWLRLSVKHSERLLQANRD